MKNLFKKVFALLAVSCVISTQSNPITNIQKASAYFALGSIDLGLLIAAAKEAKDTGTAINAKEFLTMSLKICKHLLATPQSKYDFEQLATYYKKCPKAVYFVSAVMLTSGASAAHYTATSDNPEMTGIKLLALLGLTSTTMAHGKSTWQKHIDPQIVNYYKDMFSPKKDLEYIKSQLEAIEDLRDELEETQERLDFLQEESLETRMLTRTPFNNIVELCEELRNLKQKISDLEKHLISCEEEGDQLVTEKELERILQSYRHSRKERTR